MKWLDNFIVSERGQWDHPGKLTLVPTRNGKITTRGVKNDLIGIDNLGNMKYMTPENEYQFEGNMVYEIPMKNWLDDFDDGGPIDPRRVTTNANQYTTDNKNIFEQSSIIQNPDNIADATKMYTRSVNTPGKEERFMEYFQSPDSSSFKYSHPFFGQHEIVTSNPLLRKLGDKYFSSKFNIGGDISIPDLSRPNWLDKAQKGQQVKYYDDQLKFAKAEEAYDDSLEGFKKYPLAPYFRSQNISREEFLSENNPATSHFINIHNSGNSILNSDFARGLSISPSGLRPTGNDYEWVYKRPTQKPVYKEKPKEFIPTKIVKLEREPIQLVMPQSDRTLMPYNNTMQVLRSTQKDDRSNENLYPARVVPAPNFRYGGPSKLLDKYQGNTRPSQVNFPIADRSQINNVHARESGTGLNDKWADASRVINSYDNGMPNDTSYTYMTPSESFFYSTKIDPQTNRNIMSYQTGPDTFSTPSPDLINQKKGEIMKLLGIKKDGGPLSKYQGVTKSSQVNKPINAVWSDEFGTYILPETNVTGELPIQYRVPRPLPSGAISSVPFFESVLMAPAAAASLMRAAPMIGSALNTPIAGIPGATAGNALGALGATDALINRLPVIPGQLSRGEYMDAAVNAATGALDIYGANMVSPLFKGTAKGITSTSKSKNLPLKNIEDGADKDFSWLDEEIRYHGLPELNNPKATEVLENFRARLNTPEGKRRLKALGITDKKVLDDLKIVADEKTLAQYWLNKIGINPELPEVRNVTRHEIEHAVKDAVTQSRIKDASKWYDIFFPSINAKKKVEALEETTTNIDKILEGLELRRTPEKVDWGAIKANDKKDPSKLFDYLSNRQRATNYFDSGSEGNEKSAFLAEVQQYMMDQGTIPSKDYVEVTPEMVKNTFVDAVFDETGGGKYLRLFNIMKPTETNYKLIAEGLNEMLGIAPAIGLGTAAALQYNQKPKVVPAPDFRYGGRLEKYQGDEGSSQVNYTYSPEFGTMAPEVEVTGELPIGYKLAKEALPSGAIQSTLGPIEYALMPTFAAPAIRAAMTPKTPVDAELEAIRKLLRKNVTHPKQTGPLPETPPWPNRFLELGDDAWVIGNAERGRTSIENPDIYLPGNLPRRTPRRLPGVNGTQYPNRPPQQKDGGWLDNYQDYNYIKYKDLSLSKGTGWLDNYK
jgi:hypothetical protein